MNGEKISRCLNALPDAMLEEAMKPYQPRSLGRHIVRIVAVAAVLALVMTWLLWPGETDAPEDDGVVKAPGMLKVYAYDLSSGEDVEDCKSYALKEGDESSYIGIWAPSVSMMPVGLPIRLELEEEGYAEYEITFEVTSEHGDFCRKYIGAADYEAAWLGKQFTVGNFETIYWKNSEKGQTGRVIDDKAYVDIVIWADGHIIGYTVIKIIRTHPDFSTFAAVLVKNVIFPMVDGEFQQITEEYVREQMLKER